MHMPVGNHQEQRFLFRIPKQSRIRDLKKKAVCSGTERRHKGLDYNCSKIKELAKRKTLKCIEECNNEGIPQFMFYQTNLRAQLLANLIKRGEAKDVEGRSLLCGIIKVPIYFMMCRAAERERGRKYL